MRLAVIIPVNNRRDNIEKVLTCLDRQEFDRSKNSMVVTVVDHASTDGTTEFVDKAVLQNDVLQKVFINNRDKWSASIPRNVGAKHNMNADAFYFLDSDILLPPNRIQRLLDDYMPLHSNSRVIIGPYHYLQQSISIDNPEWYLGEIKNYAQDVRWKSFEEYPVEKQNQGLGFALACFGGSILIPKELFFRVNGYDEHCVAGTEDGDMGLTLWEFGATFSMDKDMLGWHNWHEIKPDRTENIDEMVKYINEKHKMDIVNATDNIYKQWGIEWRDERWQKEGHAN